ncbi:unnamed protein product [Cuscuta europaea]|uniref:Uncharacterized protein n=1 Tax=Cuscuta europaea TaxID=41803 RepID=A0A9P0YUY2_CUSEU|nr:unnamed protein product [Cuscuta europaea]
MDCKRPQRQVYSRWMGISNGRLVDKHYRGTWCLSDTHMGEESMMESYHVKDRCTTDHDKVVGKLKFFYLDTIIVDIRYILQNEARFVVEFCRRSVNCVTHKLARATLFNVGSDSFDVFTLYFEPVDE